MTETHETAKYKRIPIKTLRRVTRGAKRAGIDPNRIRSIADLVKSVHETGVDVAIVIGAGNLWRGQHRLTTLAIIQHIIDKNKAPVVPRVKYASPLTIEHIKNNHNHLKD